MDLRLTCQNLKKKLQFQTRANTDFIIKIMKYIECFIFLTPPFILSRFYFAYESADYIRFIALMHL